MGFTEAVKTCFSKYVTFSGRATRSEYWWFVLFGFLGSIVFAIVDDALFGPPLPAGPGTVQTGSSGPLSSIFSLVIFLPMLAAAWRRMHDTGRSGLLLLIPLIVSIVTMTFLMVGVFGIGAMQNAGVDTNFLIDIATSLGIVGMFGAMIVQLAFAILILWWLTRPTMPGDNEYGPQPTR